MTATHHLTPAAPADAPAIARLHDETRAGWPGTAPARPDEIAHDLQDPRERALLVGDPREPDACQQTYDRGPYVYAFYPMVRRGGPDLERALLQHAARDAHARALPLECSLPEPRTAERDLLESLGFRHVRTFHHMILRPERLAALTPRPLPANARLELATPERLRETQNAAFATHYGHSPVDLDTVHRWFNGPTAAPQDFLMLVVDDRDVGATVHGLEPDGGHVFTLGVHPTHQQQGWGRLLLEHTCARLRERGATSIHLGVDTENAHDALAFYERTGFESEFALLRYRLDPPRNGALVL